MNRLALGAALALVAAAPTLAADPAPSPAANAPWYKRWFGIGPDPVAPPPKPERRDPALEAATVRSRAEADLDRRQRVCDELRQIAYETNNNQLETKANELERQAWELYRKQTEFLPCSKLMPAPEEKALDQRLGTTTAAAEAADKLTTPAISLPTRRATASATPREEKP
jgi:hypothetical protein